MGVWIDVKGLRKNRGWLQREAAERLGVSRAYLSTVENGKRGISINMMEAIIQVFGVKYDDFRTGIKKGEKRKPDTAPFHRAGPGTPPHATTSVLED